MKMRCTSILACSSLALVLACGGKGSGDSGVFTNTGESASAEASSSAGVGGPTDASAGVGGPTDASTDDSATDSGVLLDIAGNETNASGESGNMLGCSKVDLLFVIDDSGSMSDNQDKLTQAFPGMAQTIDDTLVAQEGIDYRIGVMSSNILDNTACPGLACGPNFLGRLQHTQARVSCNDVPAGRWIEGGDGPTVVADQFTCVASLNMAQDLNGFPEGGSEAPLEATRLGLIDRVNDAEAYNQGFLRDDALLVLILVTDEDDQSVWMGLNSWPLLGGPGSVAPVSDFWNMLVGLKGDHPENIAVVGITGPASGGGDTDAPRVHDFLSLAEPNSYWTDISGNDYSTALQEALELIEGSCGGFIPPG